MTELEPCPHCRGTGYLTAGPSAGAIAVELRETCARRGAWLSHDDRVREDVAAELLGLKAKTLANWRYSDQRLPFIMRSGRPLYALNDLAECIVRDEK